MKGIKKPNLTKIKADEIRLLDDRTHVRLKRGMYIDNKDCIIYELVDNSIDEHKKGYGKYIELSIDSKGTVTVKDNGRGLNVSPSPDIPDCSQAELALSRLKAGSKFVQTTDKTAGTNGVGSSCINFLSKTFDVTIRQNSKIYHMKFNEGIIEEKLHEIGKCEQDDHGTTIVAEVDEEMWKDIDDYNINAICKRIKQSCYLNPELTIKIDIEYGDYDIHEEYNFPEGVKKYLEDLIGDKETIHEPWHLNKTVNMNNEKTCDIDIAFVYTNSYSDTIYAFVNDVPNTNLKSSNITGFKRGIAAAIKDCFEAEYPKSKTQITAEDSREGIVAIISVKIVNPVYIGQNKDYLNMPVIASILYSEIKEFCEDQFDKLPNDKDNILNKVIESNKIREAAHKAKEAARKNKSFANKKVEKLVKCASKDPEVCEVFLVEGDSAASTATTACDKNTQAILPVFGKIPNVEEMTLDKVLSSDKLKDILYSLECGIGEDFNIDNLRYHKIIIMSDADVDGYHIATLYITLFYRYFRPIIEEGYLYLSCPPLYKIVVDKNTTLYAIDDTELNSIKQQYPNKKLNITYLKGLGELSAEGLWDSTMNPEHRTLIKITIEDAEEANKIVSMCMNSKVMNAEKRQYIMSEEDYSIL